MESSRRSAPRDPSVTDPSPLSSPRDRTSPPQPDRLVDHHRSGVIGWGIALIAAGTLWLLASMGVPIRWGLVLPIALVINGVLVLLTRRSVSRGLIGLGAVLTVAALAVSVTPEPLPFSAGNRTHTVTDLADLESDYRLGAGRLRIDLREVELPSATTELTAEVAVGELVVLISPEVAVEGEGHVAMGEIASFGEQQGGFGPTVSFSEPGDGTGRVLTLDLKVGLGRIEVAR